MGTKSRDLQLDSVQRVNDLGALSSKWRVSIISLYSVLRGFCRRGGKSRLRARMDGGQEARPSKHRQTHSVCGSMHKACLGLYQMGSQHWEKWMQAPIPNPSCVQLITIHKWEISSFQRKTHYSEGQAPCPAVDSPHKMNSVAHWRIFHEVWQDMF